MAKARRTVLELAPEGWASAPVAAHDPAILICLQRNGALLQRMLGSNAPPLLSGVW